MTDHEMSEALTLAAGWLPRFFSRQGHSELAADWTQDTLLQAWRARKQCYAQNLKQCMGWIGRIARNQMLMRVREQQGVWEQGLDQLIGENLTVADLLEDGRASRQQNALDARLTLYYLAQRISDGERIVERAMGHGANKNSRAHARRRLQNAAQQSR